MENSTVHQEIDSINRKLDIILEEIELQKRHRREMDDLKDDLMRVGKDVYQTTVLELEEVHDHLQTGDMVHLGKKLLRNVNNITKMFEQLENANDFIHDISPIAREITLDFMNRLDEFDRKGYFEFVSGLLKIMDKIVTSFTAEDVKNLGENVVTMLNIVKDLTQPDMLSALNNAISIYKKLDVDIPDKVSYMSLMKELRSPQMKKGLAFAVKFFQKIAEQQIKNPIVINNMSKN